MLGRVAGAGRWAGERWGRVLLLALQVLILAVLMLGTLVALQGVAGAQATEDWDSVIEAKFDSSATDEANNKITEAQEQRDAAQEAEENLDCSLCAESRELDEQSEQASDDTREGVAELVDARALAIEEAPAETGEDIDDKQDALDTLERYAEDWTPESSNEGMADPGAVQDAREEVEEQASEAEESSSGGSGGSSESDTEATTEEDTAAAPPPEGSDGGSEEGSGGDSGGSDEGSGGGSEEGSSGGPLAGISSALGGFGLGTLLAAGLIIVGLFYYLGGLLKEGLRERAGRVGRPTQAQAPARKPSTSKASSGPKKRPPEKPREEPRERREEPRKEEPRERPDERSGGKKEPPKEPPKGAPKGGNSSPGDSSALADRLGAGGRRRRSEAADDGEEEGD